MPIARLFRSFKTPHMFLPLIIFKLAEVKHLKQLVRNIIDPTRDLGHVDGHRKHKKAEPGDNKTPTKTQTALTSSRGETTIPTDPDAGIAKGSPDDEGGAKGDKEKRSGEVCEDCT